MQFFKRTRNRATGHMWLSVEVLTCHWNACDFYQLKMLSDKPQVLVIAEGLPPSSLPTHGPSHAEGVLSNGYSIGTRDSRPVWALPLCSHSSQTTVSLLHTSAGWTKWFLRAFPALWLDFQWSDFLWSGNWKYLLWYLQSGDKVMARTEGHFQPVFFTHWELERKESNYSSIWTCILNMWGQRINERNTENIPFQISSRHRIDHSFFGVAELWLYIPYVRENS